MKDKRNIVVYYLLFLTLIYCILILPYVFGDTGKYTLIYKIYSSNINSSDETNFQLIKNVLEKRLDFFVYPNNSKILTDQSDRVVIQNLIWRKNDLYANPEEFFEALGKPGKVIFQVVDKNYKKIDGTVIQGEQIKDLKMIRHNNNQYSIVVAFNSQARKVLNTVTEKFLGESLGLYIDNVLFLIPKITRKIDEGQISIDGLPKEGAMEIAFYVKSGVLPSRLELIEIK